MPRYYSDDDEPARRPGLFDEIFDEEWDWYAEDFASFIHHTKCSLCSQVKPCLPVHLPFYQEQVFICPDCIYILHEQLACFGYFHQIMNDDIRTGKVREEDGDKTSVSFRNVLPEKVI